MQRRPLRRPAGDRQLAVQGSDAVAETREAAAAGGCPRPTDPIVSDLDDQTVCIDADVDPRPVGAGMLTTFVSASETKK